MGKVERSTGLSAGPWLGRLLSMVTGVYTVVLVIATHYPRPQEILQRLGAGDVTDKTQHVVAYTVLGLLVAATLAAWGGWILWNALRLVAALVVFAGVDEITQPLFGRHADPADWAGDCLGIVVGVLVVAAWMAVVRSRGTGSG